MPETTFDEIVDKYVEMNVAHPFMEGNGRSTRIWLDMIFKKRLKKCVDWSKIDKREYLDAMIASHTDSSKIRMLLQQALTDRINAGLPSTHRIAKMTVRTEDFKRTGSMKVARV